MPMLSIPYKDLKRRYPGLVKKLVDQLRNSKCLQNKAPPEDLNWYLTWAIRVEAESFHPALFATRYKFPDKGTAEQRAANYCARTHWSIRSTCRGWRSSAEGSPRMVPKEIKAYALDHAKHEVAEEERAAKMTPQEKAEESARILQQLLGQPGFVAFVKPDPDKKSA